MPARLPDGQADPDGRLRPERSPRAAARFQRLWRRLPATLTYPVVGAFVGIGAPLGAAALRVAEGARLTSELAEHRFFYAYQLVGTCMVFAVAGLVAGRRVDHLRARESLYHALSEADALTRLPNVRAFEERYRRALDRAARFAEPLSLLLVDVDRLKTLNDRFGHAIGNAALRHVARILEASKRREDLAARWGGDEFVVLMPGANAMAARRVARDILTRIEQQTLLEGERAFPFTVTIGISTTSPEGSGADLFEQADKALLEGKSAGGNRLEVSSGGQG